MFTSILFLTAILHLLLPTITAAAPYNATDYFLLNCGTGTTTKSFDGRDWDGDAHSKFSPPNTESISSESIPSKQTSSATQVPYTTARIFQQSPFTYTFPLSTGPKFLRLYFYPATYSTLQKSNSFFTVTANEYTLLKNFSAFLTVTYLQQDHVIKEFVMQVSGQQLKVTFSPSPNSYAFINGIEIVSIPENYYTRNGLDDQVKYVGHDSTFRIGTNTALEALYRLNVGGNDVQAVNDTGMYRSWVQDDDYFKGGGLGFTPDGTNVTITYTLATPNYSAPVIVYETMRTVENEGLQNYMTWDFPVDSGFYYLLRLYFCEVQMEVTLPNQRVFTINIHNQTAEEEADVIMWSNGNGIPVHKDYIVFVEEESNNRRSKRNLSLSMHPNKKTLPQYYSAILNGLEIFKLNGSDSSLAAPNPEFADTIPPPLQATNSPAPEKGRSKTIFSVIGGVLGGIIVLIQ